MREKLLFFQGPRNNNVQCRRWISGVVFLLAAVAAPSARGQVLHTETLPGGTELVLVAQAEATATAVAWPERVPDQRITIRSVASGELTLASDLASAFEGAEHAPPVVIAVGAAARDELAGALAGAFGSLTPASFRPAPRNTFSDEGGTERRLGAPGSEAILRLNLPLPPLEDGRRTAVELLLNMAPQLLARDFPGLREGGTPDLVILEVHVDPAGADLYLNRLRRRLAQLGDDPGLDAGAVDRARRHLEVTRRAGLEELPTGAEHLVKIWLAGGDEAIRQYLFGASGAGLKGVREAARTWLARHPGRATILLPPQSLNPRFAGGPELELLENGISVALLERPATPLSVLCLRPVMSPDLAGDRTGTVLARLAGLLRQSENAPAWIRVTTDPPSLVVANDPDGFPEALEAVTAGLKELRRDTAPLPEYRDPRHAVLELTASLLGIRDTALTPATLLIPGNLALGAVVPDVERAKEALHKLLDVFTAPSSATAVSLEGAPRYALALPGSRSALVLLLEVGQSTDDVDLQLAAALLRSRLEAHFGAGASSVLRPDVPGRTLLVVVIEGEGTVDALEARVKEAWPRLVASPTEEELVPLRHRVASALATRASGTVGAALRCARLAAAGGGWHRPGELERMALAAEPAAVGAVFEPLLDWGGLERAVAGPLPVDALTLPKK